MTDLYVEGTLEKALGTVSGAGRAPSKSAGSISRAKLTDLNATELTELRQAVAARDGDGDSVDWCVRMDKMIVAELWLRAYTQAAIDAQAAVIIDEERRLACGSR
jgi:hypothetical protein